jgi:hypothetical protein
VFPHHLPRLFFTLYFPNPLTTEGVVSANDGGSDAAGGIKWGAGDQQAWPYELAPLQAITQLGDVWQRIARRSHCRNAMADEAGHDFGQDRSLEVFQRRLIDNLGGTQQMYVSVDESCDDRPSTKVDDAGPRSGKTADFRAGTNRADSFPCQSNRFSRRLV